MTGTSGVPSVPRFPRPVARPPVKLKFPSRYAHRFPAPDDEPFDSVNQVEFGLQYLAFVIAMFIVTASIAAFVLVPLVGTLFAR